MPFLPLRGKKGIGGKQRGKEKVIAFVCILPSVQDAQPKVRRKGSHLRYPYALTPKGYVPRALYPEGVWA